MRGLDIESAFVEPVPEDHWPDNLNMLTARQAQRVDGSWQPGGVSIDQRIADTMTTPERSLHLGVRSGGYCGTISARDDGSRVYAVGPQTNPFQVARELFRDVTADPLGYDRLREDRKSVLDVVQADVTALECKLGREERYKLDAHLTAIRDIEHGLDALRAACVVPDMGAEFTLDNDHFPQIGDLQIKLAVAALACDRTRVITLMWHQGASQLAHQWVDVPYTHHGISHNSEGVNEPEAMRHEWLTHVSTFYATEFAKLCQALDDIGEGDGTMLDNCACLWTHEQADGATHGRRDMPYVLVGSCGGEFRTGRALDFGGALAQRAAHGARERDGRRDDRVRRSRVLERSDRSELTLARRRSNHSRTNGQPYATTRSGHASVLERVARRAVERDGAARVVVVPAGRVRRVARDLLAVRVHVEERRVVGAIRERVRARQDAPAMPLSALISETGSPAC